MFRRLASVLTVLALMLGLTACVPDSTSGVEVVGDNVAYLPVGDTMVVHKSSKTRRTWVITYDGDSTVDFHCEQPLCNDHTMTLDTVGVPVEFDSRALMPGGNFKVTKLDNRAVHVEWPYGLAIQLPE